jgi:hypothetical protein
MYLKRRMKRREVVKEIENLTHIDLFSGIGGKISIDFSIPVCHSYQKGDFYGK